VAQVPKILILILFLGLGLRLVNLGQSFWLDEASQGQMSAHSLSWIWSNREGDFHPPLFYFLAHFLILVSRWEIWLRLPSVIFGVANIYMLYKLAIALKFNHKQALLSAIFLAINPYHIYYSQEFRSYSLMCFLATLSMLFLVRKKYLWLAVINALLLYTHYSSVFFILTQYLYIFFTNRKYLVSQFLSFLLFIPWLPQFVRQLNSGVSIDTYLPGWRSLLSLSPWKTFPEIFFKLVAGRINFLSLPVYIFYIFLVLAVIFLSFRHLAVQKNFLTAWTLTPVMLMFLVSFFIPQSQPFRVIYIIPALMLIFAGVSGRYAKFILSAVITVSFIGNYLYFTEKRLQREQWRPAINFLSAASDQNSAVFVKFPDKFAPFYWYNPDLTVFSTAKLAILENQKYSRVFLLEYLTDLTDPQRTAETTLRNLGFSLVSTRDFSGVGFIYEYSRS
jgi:mannosyltransferase